MNRSIQGKVIREGVRLCEALEDGGTLTVSSVRRYDGQPGGRIAWAAAIAIVQDKKAVRVSLKRRRITMGPRPHTKFINELVITKPSPDAI